MFLRSSGVALLLCFLVSSIYSQTNDSSLSSAAPTFQSKVRVVLVDVTVTDKNGQPVSGLKQNDFQVFEEGKPQTIASFEEHNGSPRNNAEPSPFIAPSAPNFFTNYPLNKPADSVNVLLLDALNTPLGDQANVRMQMVSYLKGLKPGNRLAIFTLGSHMQIVEGFTADPAALLVALDSKNFGGGLHASPMLLSDTQSTADQKALNVMGGPHANDAAIAALADFINKSEGFQNDLRVENTLDALQQLARYLSGFPGRKNLIWFSGSFPVFDVQRLDNDVRLLALKEKIKQTTNMLAAAQVAIYPITAQGLELDSFYKASSVYDPNVAPPPGMPNQGGAANAQNKSLHNDRDTRILQHTGMDDLARDTGGKAFYNTNGLNEAMNDVITNGSHYYTISYAPTDKRIDGRYRGIEVKLSSGHNKLSYRRGYFAEDTKSKKPEEAQANAIPIRALMKRGAPDATQILYQVHVSPKDAQPTEHTPIAGNNAKFQGPAIRYGVDFKVEAKALDFNAAPDGTHNGSLEVSLVAYDHDGSTLNWIARRIELSYTPDRFTAIQQSGIPFHLDIDAPQGDIYLRAGVYEVSTNKAGTLEIALNEVKAPITPAVAQSLRQTVQQTTDAAQGSPLNTDVSKSGVNNPAEPTAPKIVKLQPPPSLLLSTHTDSQKLSPSIYSVLPLPRSFDTDGYCAAIAKSVQHDEAVAAVCKFALSLRYKMPDVLCEREMHRRWLAQGVAIAAFNEDQITAKVRYRDGFEYYDDVQLSGHSAKSGDIQQFGSSWSSGEFASSLEAVFMPQSHTKFRFQKEESLNSTAALVFSYSVRPRDNKIYSLRALVKDENWAWYPGYSGTIWVDAKNLHLLKLERETAPSLNHPIWTVTTEISYANVPLGDGSNFVLPTISEVRTCLPNQEAEFCSRSFIKFNSWQKFGAKTQILMNPTQ